MNVDLMTTTSLTQPADRFDEVNSSSEPNGPEEPQNMRRRDAGQRAKHLLAEFLRFKQLDILIDGLTGDEVQHREDVMSITKLLVLVDILHEDLLAFCKYEEVQA